MDTLFSLKVFCKVVEKGSFTKASDSLSISNAMASKHVSHLENKVQARLLNRSSRSLSLTNEGEIYYQQCLQALELLEQAENDVSIGKQTPKGHLRVAVPVWFATSKFARWVTEYQSLYPEVSIDLVLDNAMNDLVSDGFDLALRVSTSMSVSIIARPLMNIPFVFVSSPEYLLNHDKIIFPKDLENHKFVLPSYIDISEVSFTTKDTFNSKTPTETLKLTTYTQSNNTVMLKELVQAGAGLSVLPYLLVEEAIKNNKLVVLFEDEFFHDVVLHAVYLSRRHQSAKVRSFIDFMVGKAE